jgi:mono/diheme cytochrome c family protein
MSWFRNLNAAWRYAVAGIGALAIIFLIAFFWIVFGPGPLDFAKDSPVALADYRGSDPSGVPLKLRSASLVKRGEYLARAADCQPCHTAEGGAPFAGGLALVTPFGTIYSANITPDKDTGIGRWTDAQFLGALHHGIGAGNKHLYPAMPFASYTGMTDADALAIKAYLFSFRPIHAIAPQNSLVFALNQRWLNNRRKFSGATQAGWRAYNITADKTSGVGGWSDRELAEYLAIGHAEDHGTAAGPMGEAVDNSLAYLAKSDIDDIVAYLRSVPAISTPDLPAPKIAPAPASHKDGVVADYDRHGKQLFESACASCHGWTGVSPVTPIATLTGARAVNDPSAINVADIVLNGTQRTAPGGAAFMPAFGSSYSNVEVAEVANYVVARFGAARSRIAPKDIAKLRREN